MERDPLRRDPLERDSLQRDPLQGDRRHRLEYDTLLDGFRPSEQRAILGYCARLGKDPRVAVELAEAVRAWESGLGRCWRREKMSLDCRIQMTEIERHKYLVSERLGHDIGWERAACDWIEKHAGEWRDWWESQPDSEPGLEGV